MEFNRVKVDKVILVDGMFCLFDENFVVNKEVENKIKSYGARVIIITNAPSAKMQKIADETGFEIVTYENNPPKTDEKYFEKMLTEKGLKSENCVYLDHLEENLASAKKS